MVFDGWRDEPKSVAGPTGLRVAKSRKASLHGGQPGTHLLASGRPPDRPALDDHPIEREESPNSRSVCLGLATGGISRRPRRPRPPGFHPSSQEARTDVARLQEDGKWLGLHPTMQDESDEKLLALSLGTDVTMRQSGPFSPYLRLSLNRELTKRRALTIARSFVCHI